MLVADALSVEVAVFVCLVVVDVLMEAVVEELAIKDKSVLRRIGDQWSKTANKTLETKTWHHLLTTRSGANGVRRIRSARERR